jgi:hypothetical protein
MIGDDDLPPMILRAKSRKAFRRRVFEKLRRPRKLGRCDRFQRERFRKRGLAFN